MVATCESWTTYQRCTQRWPFPIRCLRHLAKINLARQNTALVHAFVASPVDYCNALMASTTDKLQRAFNAAALRLLTYILTYLTRKFRTSEKYRVGLLKHLSSEHNFDCCSAVCPECLTVSPKGCLLLRTADNSRPRGRPQRRYKDNLKANVQCTGIDHKTWENLVSNRSNLRGLYNWCSAFRGRSVESITQKSSCEAEPSSCFICDVCGRRCTSRIDFTAH